jgi:hypothetical protein
MSDTAEGPQQDTSVPAVHQPSETPAAADELEPQLKYERLGADVKSILQDATATCLCLSEKVLALGTSAGNTHILDYSGNEVSVLQLVWVWGSTSSKLLLYLWKADMGVLPCGVVAAGSTYTAVVPGCT